MSDSSEELAKMLETVGVASTGNAKLDIFKAMEFVSSEGDIALIKYDGVREENIIDVIITKDMPQEGELARGNGDNLIWVFAKVFSEYLSLR